VVPETVVAAVVAMPPVAITFAVVPDKAVAAAVVAVTYVAMAYVAVYHGRFVVTGRVVKWATAVTTKHVALTTPNVVPTQMMLIAALELIPFAVKGLVVTLWTRSVVKEIAVIGIYAKNA